MEELDTEMDADFKQWKEETAEKERQLIENKISDKEMMNKMTKLVFNHVHLQDLKAAIGEVLDVFMEIIDTPSKSYKDVKNRLEKVHSSRWYNIQKRYKLLGEDGLDGVTNSIPEKERNSVTGIVTNFITHVDKCTQSVIEKLEEKHRDVLVMEGKVKQMEERLCQTEDMFLHQKSMFMEKSTQNAGLLASKQHLDELLKEKNKRIEELEKQSNVQVWELEKNRILKETNERIKHLEDELNELKEGREKYKKRMSNIDSSYQKMKMKQQLLTEKAEKAQRYSDDFDSDRETSDKLSRTNYLQDKEIAYLERELYDLQSNTVGVIGGMKIDINSDQPALMAMTSSRNTSVPFIADPFSKRSKLGPKLLDEHGRIDKDFEQLSARVRKIYTAVLDGEVKKAKEELPAHYRYHQDDSFRLKKLRRLSQPTLPPTRLLHSIMDENKKQEIKTNEIKEGNTGNITPDLEDGVFMGKAFQTPESYLLSDSSDTLSQDSFLMDETSLLQSSNPVIVNPNTKKLHPINPLKHFPHMSQQFILDHYEKFLEYDKNGDGSLDLTEVVKVVQFLGITFNAHQLQEAMEEVDKDNNHTLDFYEYLLIIDNIYRRNGKASLFKEGLTEIKKKNALVSKSCVIQ